MSFISRALNKVGQLLVQVDSSQTDTLYFSFTEMSSVFIQWLITDIYKKRSIAQRHSSLALFWSGGQKIPSYTRHLRGCDHYSDLSYIRLQPMHIHFKKVLLVTFTLLNTNDTSSYVHSWVIAMMNNVWAYGLRETQAIFLQFFNLG